MPNVIFTSRLSSTPAASHQVARPKSFADALWRACDLFPLLAAEGALYLTQQGQGGLDEVELHADAWDGAFELLREGEIGVLDVRVRGMTSPDKGKAKARQQDAETEQDTQAHDEQQIPLRTGSASSLKRPLSPSTSSASVSNKKIAPSEDTEQLEHIRIVIRSDGYDEPVEIKARRTTRLAKVFKATAQKFGLPELPEGTPDNGGRCFLTETGFMQADETVGDHCGKLDPSGHLLVDFVLSHSPEPELPPMQGQE